MGPPGARLALLLLFLSPTQGGECPALVPLLFLLGRGRGACAWGAADRFQGWVCVSAFLSVTWLIGDHGFWGQT